MIDTPVNSINPKMTVHATTACLAMQRYEHAAQKLSSGLAQQPWGKLSTTHVQLCPQHPYFLDEPLLDEIKQILPDSQLRLHATVPIQSHHFFSEQAWWSDDSKVYWERIAQLSRYIKAPAYVFHAGPRKGHTFEELLDQARRFEQLFECPVAIEGIYPDVTNKIDCFISSWAEYRLLMESGIRFVVDLSHLNVVAHVSGSNDLGLTQEMLLHPNCMEIHVSDNDGQSDRHSMMRPDAKNCVWWMPLLERAAIENPHALIFSESCRPWKSIL